MAAGHSMCVHSISGIQKTETARSVLLFLRFLRHVGAGSVKQFTAIHVQLSRPSQIVVERVLLFARLTGVAAAAQITIDPFELKVYVVIWSSEADLDR